jgi:hypothetical protein
MRVRRVRCSLLALSLGDHRAQLSVALGSALSASAYAAAPQPTSTTIPDSTFGEGGTKQSVLNDNRELLVEVFRDKSGIIREQHENAGGGEEYWGFFFQDGSSSTNWGGSIIAVRPMERPANRWELRVYSPGNLTLKEASFLSRDELDSEFAHWHSQMRAWVNGFIRTQDTQ